jgi:DNA-directed RNA polymerase subunit RPC12/RpoP
MLLYKIFKFEVYCWKRRDYMKKYNCIICGNEIEEPSISYNINGYNCQSCGPFAMPLSMVRKIEAFLNYTRLDLGRIAGYLFESREAFNQYESGNYGVPLMLDAAKIKSILEDPFVPNTITEKLDKILIYLDKHSEYFGQVVVVPPQAAYAMNLKEFEMMIHELSKEGYIYDSVAVGEINGTIIGNGLILKLSGIKYLKERKSLKNPNECFVAMWFEDAETGDLWNNAIQPGCTDAGYHAVRIDKKEHNNFIVDEILSGIRKSHFLIADFTGQNRGVYFEAGFARGLGKEVIQLCRKDHFEKVIDPNTKKARDDMYMHFDTAQIKTIIWEKGKESDIRERIRFRIERTFGPGGYQKPESIVPE